MRILRYGFCLLAFAAGARATEFPNAVCPTGQVLRWTGGGALGSTANNTTCTDSGPYPPDYIWYDRYLNPGTWGARVAAECDGSKYLNFVTWTAQPHACGSAGGTACVDASINGNPPLEAATLDFICLPLPEDNCCGIGHPVQPATGTKTFAETDFSAGALRLVRHYSSVGPRAAVLTVPSTLGFYWRTNYDKRLYPVAGSGGATMVAVRADARVKYFAADGSETAHFDGTPAETLLPNGVGGWIYSASDDSVENYDASGKLVSIAEKGIVSQVLRYDSLDRIVSVTDAQGRTLSYSYSGSIAGLPAAVVTISASDGSAYTYTLDTRGNLKSVGYPDGGLRSYSYGNRAFPHAVTEIFDENRALYERIDYDASGRALDSYLGPSLAHSDIERHGFAYNADGTLTHTDPLGATQTLTFATIGGIENFVGMDAPCGSCGVFGSVKAKTYDAAGYVQSKLDFNNQTTRYVYDDTRGLELKRIEASGTPQQRTTTTAWNANFRLPDKRSIAAASGAVEAIETWAYNSRGQALARCQADPALSAASAYVCGSAANAPDGVRQWTYTYCEKSDVGARCALVGELLRVDGPRTDVADVTTYAYYASTDLSGCGTASGTCYALGDLKSVTNALGQVTTYVRYDRNGRITRQRDANGVYTDFTYDARGRLSARTVRANADGTSNAALDATLTILSDNAGNVVQVTQPDGTYLRFRYDGAHRLTDVYDSAGGADYTKGDHIHYALDAAGNRVDEQTFDPSGALKRELSRTYNKLNRLTALLTSANVALQTFTNPVDAAPAGITYTDGYDGNGNAIYSLDGSAYRAGTENVYDPLNRLVKILQDHAGTGSTHDTTTLAAYDARNNVRSVTDPDGLTTSYAFDGLNNLTALDSPDTGHTAYGYDAAGNRSTQTDARGVTASYGYDALNRPLGIAYPNTSLNVAYAYDQAAAGCYNVGRLTAMTDASGSTTYCYDARGNVSSKTQRVGNVILTTSYGYTLADQVSQITYPSGAVASYGRDAAGRIASVTYKKSAGANAVALLSGIGYYPFGPRNVLTFGNGRTLTTAYDTDYHVDLVSSSNTQGVYVDASTDAMGTLVAARIVPGGVPIAYGYDPLGRLTNVKQGTSSGFTATYNASGDRLTVAGPSQRVATYTYVAGTHRLDNVSGTPSRVFDANGNPVLKLGSTTFAYDDRNRLASITLSNGITVAYNYNGRGERVFKTGTVFSYLENGRLVGEYSATGALQKEYLWADDALVGVTDASTLYYVESDALGTPRQVIKPGATSSGDTIAWAWPFGQTFQYPFGDAAVSGQALTFNLRFPGQYYDAESGMHYNYFRDYEPQTGRYAESDPIGLDGGIATYGYVAANPLNRSDFYGLAGCGSGWNERLVPDNPFRFQFSSCCDTHDDCYDCKGVEQGYTKKDCDTNFRNCMRGKCTRYSFPIRFICNRIAGLYYEAVNKFGQSAYDGGTKDCPRCNPAGSASPSPPNAGTE